MNIAGFTPTDTILAYSGLVWMGQLLHVFQGHGLYWVLITGGLIWGLVQTLRGRAALVDVAIHVGLALVLLQLLGGNGISLDFPRSFAEQSGGRVTAEAAAQQPAGAAVVPRGFMLLVSAMQDTVQELLPRINSEFVVRPFALFAATNSLMTEALQHDPALRARTADFLDRCYAPAVTRWLQARPGANREDLARVDTPLSDELVPLYSQILVAAGGEEGAGGLSPCAELWVPLKTDLFEYATNQGGTTWMGYISQQLSWRTVGTEVWLRNALRQFRAGHSFGGAFNSTYPTGERPHHVAGVPTALGSEVLGWTGFAMNWIRIAQLVEIVRYAAFPLMGYLLAILYIAFPVVLAMGLLPGGMGRLVTYFALVWSVKAWPLAWAVVDQVYTTVLPTLWPLVDRGWDIGNIVIDKPPAALNLVTGLMYITGPVILTMAMGIAGSALGHGLSSFSAFRVGFGTRLRAFGKGYSVSGG